MEGRYLFKGAGDSVESLGATGRPLGTATAIICLACAVHLNLHQSGRNTACLSCNRTLRVCLQDQALNTGLPRSFHAMINMNSDRFWQNSIEIWQNPPDSGQKQQ